ncbi:MAG: septation protein A [Alphaproteobacteria bacterium]|nr:septation protein A [Alphaproteobacteria bacterium]
MPARSLTASQRFILDLGPLAVFFIGYRFGDLMLATASLIFATLLSLAITYLVEKRVALAPLVSGSMVAVFGGLTLLLNDPLFIKMKPTLVNCLFALVLLVGAYGFKRGLLKYLLEMAFSITDEGWRVLSARWGFFFLFLALLNEMIWRNFSTDFWVSFKVFGMFTITILFAASQYKLVQRYAVKAE